MELRHEYRYVDDDTVEFIIKSPKHGEFKVLIDAVDKEKVLQYKWHMHNVRNPWTQYCYNNKIGLLHRLITNAPKDMFTDHINGDGLNNKESNLRVCTNQENAYNKAPRKANPTKYKGIYYMKATKRMTAKALKKPWIAQLKYQGKNFFLGTHATKEEAALAYDKKAIEIFGEYAKLNFPERSEEYLAEIQKEGEKDEEKRR